MAEDDRAFVIVFLPPARALREAVLPGEERNWEFRTIAGRSKRLFAARKQHPNRLAILVGGVLAGEAMMVGERDCVVSKRDFVWCATKVKLGSCAASKHIKCGILTRFPRSFNVLRAPIGVDDAELVALQCNRKRQQKFSNFLFFLRSRDATRKELGPGRTGEAIGTVGMVDEPSVPFFLFTAKEIVFVVAKHHLRDLLVHQMLNEFDDGDAVGAPIDEVADEDQRALGTAAGDVDVKAAKQPLQGFNLPMNIADDVDTIVKEGANKRHRRGA